MATLTRRRPVRRSHGVLAFNSVGTGNVTDLTRGATNTSGDDGLTNDLSTGLWHQGDSGNLVANGGAETNTTGWVEQGSTTTRITTQQKFGAACLNVVTSNLGANEGPYHAFTGAAGTKYTASAWVRGTSGTVRIALYDDVAGKQASSAVTLSTTWQRITVTATTGALSTVFRAYIETDAQQNITFQIDGVQVENGAIATPYIETDGLGGTTRDSAEIRLNAAGTKGLFTPQQGWVAVRARMGFASTDVYATNAYLFSWNTATSNCIEAYFTATQAVMKNDATAGAAAQTVGQNFTFTKGDIITVIGAWAPDNFKVSANGAAFSAMGSRTEVPAITTSNLRIGLRSIGATELDGDIFWAAMGSGTLTNADANRIHLFGNNKPDWFQLPGHPTGFWDGIRPYMTKIHG